MVPISAQHSADATTSLRRKEALALALEPLPSLAPEMQKLLGVKPRPSLKRRFKGLTLPPEERGETPTTS
jgi:hypothetical protein